ncbi:MAG: hypothetical protein AABW89_03270 [Nanoarchaeota archaeon]
MTNKAGEAYAFFYCGASKTAIEGEIPLIRKVVGTPSALELSLTEGMDNVEGNDGLRSLALEAKQSGINYMFKARLPNRTNRETADEIALVINQAYQSPLYNADGPFNREIVYEENGTYVFRE